MAYIVRRIGMEAQTVHSGEDAMASMRNRVPGLVLLDYVMSGMSGLDVLREMKLQPSLTAVPVVFISGCMDEQTCEAARALGANEILTKTNFDHVELERVIRQHLFSGN